METAIGVFSSRERAAEAVHELLNGKVPEESIVFLTRSQTEAEVVGKELGATVGGFMGVGTGMSAGVLAATMLAVRGLARCSHWALALPRYWDCWAPVPVLR